MRYIWFIVSLGRNVLEADPSIYQYFKQFGLLLHCKSRLSGQIQQVLSMFCKILPELLVHFDLCI